MVRSLPASPRAAFGIHRSAQAPSGGTLARLPRVCRPRIIRGGPAIGGDRGCEGRTTRPDAARRVPSSSPAPTARRSAPSSPSIWANSRGRLGTRRSWPTSNRVWRIVAIRWRAVTGSDWGAEPSRLERPMTRPVGRPPPDQQQRAEVAPVVAAPLGVDPRGPAHLAAGDQQDLLVEPAGVQVLDEGREGVVEGRAHVAHPLDHRRVVLVGVHVPDEVGRHRDEAAAALAEPAGQEQQLARATWRCRRSCCGSSRSG